MNIDFENIEIIVCVKRYYEICELIEEFFVGLLLILEYVSLYKDIF